MSDRPSIRYQYDGDFNPATCDGTCPRQWIPRLGAPGDSIQLPCANDCTKGHPADVLSIPQLVEVKVDNKKDFLGRPPTKTVTQIFVRAPAGRGRWRWVLPAAGR